LSRFRKSRRWAEGQEKLKEVEIRLLPVGSEDNTVGISDDRTVAVPGGTEGYGDSS
jgi:hypothetical protein